MWLLDKLHGPEEPTVGVLNHHVKLQGHKENHLQPRDRLEQLVVLLRVVLELAFPVELIIEAAQNAVAKRETKVLRLGTQKEAGRGHLLSSQQYKATSRDDSLAQNPPHPRPLPPFWERKKERKLTMELYLVNDRSWKNRRKYTIEVVRVCRSSLKSLATASIKSIPLFFFS